MRCLLVVTIVYMFFSCIKFEKVRERSRMLDKIREGREGREGREVGESWTTLEKVRDGSRRSWEEKSGNRESHPLNSEYRQFLASRSRW